MRWAGRSVENLPQTTRFGTTCCWDLPFRCITIAVCALRACVVNVRRKLTCDRPRNIGMKWKTGDIAVSGIQRALKRATIDANGVASRFTEWTKNMYYIYIRTYISPGGSSYQEDWDHMTNIKKNIKNTAGKVKWNDICYIKIVYLRSPKMHKCARERNEK